MELTGGQWFVPTIFLLLILAVLSIFATKKSDNEKMKFWLNFAMYGLMVVVVIIFWIWYFKGKSDFYNAAIFTAIVIYLILDQLIKKYKDVLMRKLGSKYSWLKGGIISIYILTTRGAS